MTFIALAGWMAALALLAALMRLSQKRTDAEDAMRMQALSFELQQVEQAQARRREQQASSELADKARVLMQAQEQWLDRSGEAKRHQVLAQLIDAFPQTRKRELAAAIEAVMQERA